MKNLQNIAVLGVCMVLASAASATATAAAYWAACTDCGGSAKNFALGVPPDRQGNHIVHVYDEATASLQSFSVFIYYNYEFHGWSRVGRAIPSSVQALNLLNSVKDAQSFVSALADLADPIRVGIASVQDYLLSGGALDTQIATNLLNGLHEQGLHDRVTNAATLLLSDAGRMITQRPVEATFRAEFDDGSTMLVTATFIANNLNNPIIDSVAGSGSASDR